MIKISNFLSDSERVFILSQESFIKPSCVEISNDHIKKINSEVKGWSILKDFTGTLLSREVSKFQGDSTQVDVVPEIFYELSDRIADKLVINKDHVFFQYIHLGVGGRVAPHYDVGIPGFVTYKCNVCVSGPETDYIWQDKECHEIRPGDLYSFEANFFRHWMDKSDFTRIHLSYGFMLPYSDLGWSEDSPRVRLSNRIWKKFIV